MSALMNTTITRLPHTTISIIALAFFLNTLAGLAQTTPPVAADTAWDALPDVVNVHCLDAKSDRNGNWLCTVNIGDTARFGSTTIVTGQGKEDQGVARYGADGTPLWIRPAGDDRWQGFSGFDADPDGNSFALFSIIPIATRTDSLRIGDRRLNPVGGTYLAKYSPSGDLLWTTWLGDSIIAQDVAADGHGGAVVVGEINGGFIYGQDTLAISGKRSSMNRIAAAVIGVTADGSFRWARTVTRKNNTSAINVAVAPNSDIIVSGLLYQPATPDTTIIGSSRITSPGMYVARYRANGDAIWARGMTSGAMELTVADIAFDSSGNIILAGHLDYQLDEQNIGKIFWDTLGAAGERISAYGYGNIFMTKMSGEGRLLWAQTMQGRMWNVPRNVLSAPDGGIFLTGELSGHVMFNGHDYYAQGTRAGFAARYDANGNPGWLKIYDVRGQSSAAMGAGSVKPVGAYTDQEGRLWMLGRFSGWMQFDSFTIGTAPITRFDFLVDKAGNTFAVRLAPGSHAEPARIWTHIDDGLVYNRKGFAAPDVQALAVFGGQIHAGLAPGDDRPWQMNSGNGIYSSSNHGTAWTRHTGIDRAQDPARYGVVSFATLGDSLYTVTGLFGGVSAMHRKAMVMNRNTPGHWNWLQRSGDPDLFGVYTINGVLYGAAREYGPDTTYGLLRWSRDSMTWNPMDATVLGKVKVQALTGYGDVLVATAYDFKGLFRSGDRGRTWERTSNGLPLTSSGQFPGAHDLATVGTSIYLAPPAGMGPKFPTGVYRSDDGGVSWTQANEGLPHKPYGPSDTLATVIDILYAKHGVLFAGGEEGIWMLPNGETRWVTITDDIQQCRVNAILADDTYLYAAMNYCGMWRRPLSALGIEVEKEPEPQPNPGVRQSGLTIAPNPATLSSLISFTLPEAGQTTVSLYDREGRLVHVIAKGMMEDGDHELVLDMRGLPSGTYFVRVQNGEWSASTGLVYHK